MKDEVNHPEHYTAGKYETIDIIKDIHDLMTNFGEFLQEKNRRYGDSALNPVKIFSKHEPENPLCSRLDEKIQRIMNADEIRKNDVCDLFGYIALYMIGKDWKNFKEFLD